MSNRGFAYTEVVGREGEGLALLAYLTAFYDHTAESRWRERILEGFVLVDGVPADPSAVLRSGQAVTWMRPPWQEPHVPLLYAVIHEDDQLLAVAKPAGLPTMAGGGYLEHTLLALVRIRYPGASPLHRLGRGTSGVVLFARTGEAASSLSREWRNRRVIKTYRALVEGSPGRDEFSVDAPIGPVPHPLLGSVHAASPEGKGARSDVRVLERRDRDSLVEVVIETGRPHQIRIHMAVCGHPLAGDPLYAAGGRLLGEGKALPGDAGYRLHALRLEFSHPATGAPMKIECPPPRALRMAREAEPDP